MVLERAKNKFIAEAFLKVPPFSEKHPAQTSRREICIGLVQNNTGPWCPPGLVLIALVLTIFCHLGFLV